MRGILLSLSIMIMIGFALTGCSINDSAQDENSPLEQVAFYSNDKNANRDSGAFRFINDRGFNDQHMVNQVRTLDGGNDLGEQDRAFSKYGDGNYGYDDYNYHGHLNTTFNGVPTRSYNTGHDNIVAQRITDRIEHVTDVNDVAAIIDGNTILVVIDTDDDDSQAIEKKVRRIVEGMANGREVRVVTDKGMFGLQ
ncbi:YhcN/YlaJ family sporulation lipoprotein [Schinkia azotoformans]|uniref:YhcN/YlaJ family sporulation lipoprotein n=1 Tax=Schinkia azotoformans TaxID=1454 RepID=UPI002DBD5C81|nr:YhcN/YlaJ family sporulation lipoprotein [Schinkia azotoformans]MEC1717947.1 YhcN/YlaJ family sporulation lipoprotein [Schinkia azotoformans]MEC1739849.1 YhcN/YlaJ family sporulation lipoprotein [Schinkia azotoformans]MEC1746471.1 YhcN/YlaJ family sporulation lipoprotein [Schinkia azotoformans]MEC1766001.1 YhcN/YlaJ family sporulation lipoprotein [Schinkia azotoformans]MEC1787523.1 YhcN/YlaJ family sporulation lipoprotein [Schinkia azotoformans]